MLGAKGHQILQRDYWQTFRMLLAESDSALCVQKQEEKQILVWARIFRLGETDGRTDSLEAARRN